MPLPELGAEPQKPYAAAPSSEQRASPNELALRLWAPATGAWTNEGVQGQ